MFSSYDKFTTNFKKVIQRAAWICLNELKKVITPTHLLWGIFSTPECLAHEVLKNLGLHDPALHKELSSNTTINPLINYNEVFSLSMEQSAIRILERAADIAVLHRCTYVGTEHLLAAMLELKTPALIEELERAHVLLQELHNKLQNILEKNSFKTAPIAQRNNANLERTSLPATEAKHIKQGIAAQKKKRHFEEVLLTPTLDMFTTDLTSAERQKKSHPLVGRNQEIERLIHILSRKHKNNPLLLGDPGVGKTAIVEGLAERIYEGKVPDILAHKRILNLDLNAIVAGTMYRGEFENRLKQIIEEITSQDDIVLFIDEIHNLVGAGSATGSLDAANILKPYLARGDISCIGATTMAEYKAHFEHDQTLDRRFQIITVAEPTLAETLEILKGIKNNLEDYHRVTITDDALSLAVSLSDRFIPNKYFPDKAIDLIDEAASRAKVEHSKDTFGKQIRSIRNEIKRILTEKEEAVRKENFGSALQLKEAEEAFLKKLDSLKLRQEKEHKIKIAIVDKQHIVQIITDTVKIPFLEMAHVNREKLLQLTNLLSKHVRGQKAVLDEIAKTLRRSEAGLADPKRPLASFIFLGPSGVGKTETAKAIAEEVFNDKNALIRINMSEFAESFNVTKLIGAPAGYVGYKEGNQLADKVRSKPYAVVLFDEMEKAHPDVFNLLLQVLEDGYFVDAAGKHINFKNTVIIFTSNIGLERFNQAQTLGFAAKTTTQKAKIHEQFEAVKENIFKELHATYRVEFLNRIDKILVFEPLTPETLVEIVDTNIQFLNNKLQEKNMLVDITPAARKLLSKRGFSPDDGARGIRRIVQEEIEERLVEKILTGIFKAGDTVKIGVKDNKITITK